MQEHIRTCRGCNQKEEIEKLLRYVLSHDKTTLIFDSGKKMSTVECGCMTILIV